MVCYDSEIWMRLILSPLIILWWPRWTHKKTLHKILPSQSQQYISQVAHQIFYSLSQTPIHSKVFSAKNAFVFYHRVLSNFLMELLNQFYCWRWWRVLMWMLKFYFEVSPIWFLIFPRLQRPRRKSSPYDVMCQKVAEITVQLRYLQTSWSC